MAKLSPDEPTPWPAVIGRSLAYLCLVEAGLREKDLTTQGRFLETLGLTRKEAAALIGTTYGSLTELYSKANRRKGAKKSGSKTTKRRK